MHWDFKDLHIFPMNQFKQWLPCEKVYGQVTVWRMESRLAAEVV